MRESNSDTQIVLSGILKKRAGRMSRWCNRYFTLAGNRLEYKLTEEAIDIRATFDLSPGCRVTDVVSEGQGIRAKKLYTFWVVWPHQKNREQQQQQNLQNDTDVVDGEDGFFSDDDEDGPDVSYGDKQNAAESREKGLKHILTNQQQEVSRQKKIVQKQIDRHQAHDGKVGMVPKVAAAALGGLIVGALTFGVGVIPFLTVVGGFAVAGGSTAVLNYRRPLDSRLVLAADTEFEARKWKQMIEQSIVAAEKKRGPRMPSAVNARLVSALAKLSPKVNGISDYGRWRRCKTLEDGVGILELTQPPMGHTCRCAHVLVPTPPLDAFLALMETPLWPGHSGIFRVLQVIDNNTDILCIRLRSDCSAKGGRTSVWRTFYFSRFWNMTDEGCYFITLNGISVHEINRSRNDGGAIRLDDELEYNTSANSGDEFYMDAETVKISGILDVAHAQPLFDAVMTIAPRKDHAEFDNEVPEALVSCSIQVSDDLSVNGDNACMWEVGEMETTTEGFISACLVDLKNFLVLSKFGSQLSENATCLQNTQTMEGVGNTAGGELKPSIGVSRAKFTTEHRGEVSPIVLDLRKHSEDKQLVPRFKSPGPSDSIFHKGSENKVASAKEMKLEASATNQRYAALGTIGATRQQELRETEMSPCKTRFVLRDVKPSSLSQLDMNSFNSNALGPLSYQRDDSRLWGRDKFESLPANLTLKLPDGRKGNAHYHSLGLMQEDASKAIVAAPPTMFRERSGSFSISRSSEVNNEAALLRGQIAAKEYEQHRLHKVAYMHNANASNEALTLLQHQTNELQLLKEQYQNLTGSTYEHIRTGKLAGSARRLGNLSFASMSSTNTASGSKMSLTSEISAEEEVATAPPHWLPTKMERAEWDTTDVRTTDSFRSCLSVLLRSLFVIALSIVFANLLSTI